jgi:UDP-glucose 4-epimerase
MVLALKEAGKRVVVLDNFSTGFKWAAPEGVPYCRGETGDQALVECIIVERGVEAIIHFAASIAVPESVAGPLDYYRNNTASSRTLIECRVKGGVKQFIFSSTAAVYGNPAKIPIGREDPVSAGVALRISQAHGRDHATRRQCGAPSRLRHFTGMAIILMPLPGPINAGNCGDAT